MFLYACFCLQGLPEFSCVFRWSHCAGFIGAPWGPQTTGWNIQALWRHTVAFVAMNWSEGENASVKKDPFHCVYTKWTHINRLDFYRLFVFVCKTCTSLNMVVFTEKHLSWFYRIPKKTVIHLKSSVSFNKSHLAERQILERSECQQAVNFTQFHLMYSLQNTLFGNVTSTANSEHLQPQQTRRLLVYQLVFSHQQPWGHWQHNPDRVRNTAETSTKRPAVLREHTDFCFSFFYLDLHALGIPWWSYQDTLTRMPPFALQARRIGHFVSLLSC